MPRTRIIASPHILTHTHTPSLGTINLTLSLDLGGNENLEDDRRRRRRRKKKSCTSITNWSSGQGD
jgi:hypothetical protein